MTRLVLEERLPAADRTIDIVRIELHDVAAALRLGRGDQGRAGTAEAVEYDSLRLRAILDRVHHHGAGLHRGVARQLRHPALAEAVDPCIAPQGGTVATVLAELDVVDVRSLAGLPQRDQLGLATIERTHPGIGLGPGDHRLQLVEDAVACVQHLVQMRTVDAAIDQRSIPRCRRDLGEDRMQEAGDLELAHLAGGHRELAVLNLAQAADMAVHLQIVGRIREHHLSEFTAISV